MYRERFRKESFGWIYSDDSGKIRILSVDPSLPQKKPLDHYEIKLKDIPKEELLRLTAPIIVSLELTKACNLKCNHCYLDAGKKRTNELTLTQVKSVLKELKDMGVFFVFITGGEPLLRTDFVDIIDYLYEIDLDFNVLTNGTLLTEDMLGKLDRRTVFVISLDGINSQRTIRTNSENYPSTSETAALLRHRGFPFIMQYTLQKKNFEDLARTYEWAEENEILFVAMDVMALGRAALNRTEVLPTDEDLFRIKPLMDAKLHYEKCLETFTSPSDFSPRAIANPNYYNFIADLVSATQQPYAGNSYLYIASDGSLYPDNFYASKKKYAVGNIGQESILKSWASCFEDYRRLSFDDFDCLGCEVYKDGIYCDYQIKVASENYYGQGNRCGAGDFLRQAFVLRQKDRESSGENLTRDQAFRKDNY